MSGLFCERGFVLGWLGDEETGIGERGWGGILYPLAWTLLRDRAFIMGMVKVYVTLLLDSREM